MKLVSTSTWYGGPSCVLYLKYRALGILSLHTSFHIICLHCLEYVQHCPSNFGLEQSNVGKPIAWGKGAVVRAPTTQAVQGDIHMADFLFFGLLAYSLMPGCKDSSLSLNSGFETSQAAESGSSGTDSNSYESWLMIHHDIMIHTSYCYGYYYYGD
jgi:hypothetical protein